MRLLLDTHALLWWLNDDEKLGNHARGLIGDPENDVLLSAVSLWEITVKLRIGKLDADIEEILAILPGRGFDRLDIQMRILSLLRLFRFITAIPSIIFSWRSPWRRERISFPRIRMSRIMAFRSSLARILLSRDLRRAWSHCPSRLRSLGWHACQRRCTWRRPTAQMAGRGRTSGERSLV